MMKTHTVRLLTAGVLTGMLAAGAHATMIDFDTVGNLTNNFSLNSGTGNRYVELDSVGVGASRGVGLNGSGFDSTAMNTSAVHSLNTDGSMISLSLMMFVNNNSSASTALQLGIGGNSAVRFEGGAHEHFVTLRLQTSGSSGLTNQFQVAYKPASVSNNVVITSLPGVTNLTAGNWYMLSADFLNNGGSEVRVSGSLQDFGTDGLTPGDVLLSVSDFSVANQFAMTSDDTVYGGFRGFPGAGPAYYDNFSIVPEPSTILMLLPALAWFARYRRRA